MRALRTLPALFIAIVFCGALFAQQPISTEAPLTNADILKLTGLHLGDDVLIAKINQAPAVNFDLSGEGLAKLHSGGISSPVIAAMLKRSTPSDRSSTPPEVAQARARAMAVMGGFGDVTLHTKDGDTELSSRTGSYSQTFAVFAYLTFLNYPGVSSKIRTSDRRPSLLAHLQNDPRDRQESSLSFLVTLDASKKGDERALKIGKAYQLGSHGFGEPDKDWTIEYDATQESPGLWRITPKKDLKPGEYGLFLHTRQMLFDFAVD